MTENGSLPSDPAIVSPPQAAKQPEAAASAPPLPAEAPLPGARTALAVLLLINLFNYIDRQILAANVTPIERQLLPYREPDSVRLTSTIGLLASSSGYAPLTAAAALHPLRAEQGQDNKERIGDLAFAFMVSYMLIAPLFGWLANRMSRWRLIAVGVILWSLASGASGLAGTFHDSKVAAGGVAVFFGSFGFLLLTRCFIGVGEAAYGPIAPTLISDLYPVKIRGSVLAWFYAAIPVGSALGYVVGGLLGWPDAFYWVVPPGLVLGLCCWLMPEPKSGQADLTHDQPVRRPRLREYLVLFRTPSYVLDTLGMTAMTFSIGGIAIWMPDYIYAYRGEPNLDRVTTIFGGIVVVSGLGATLLGGIIGDRLRPRIAGSYFLVSGLSMLVAFPLFLAVLYVPFPLAWILIFLACFFLFFNTGPTNTILANVSHPAIRAQAFAINILIIHLFGDAYSPKIMGRIADRFAVGGQANMDAAFLAVSGMILLGALCWLAGTPFLARDTALAPKRLDSPTGPSLV
jgi:MFS transporter, Spinster family, sphingosine-1-phosphate transporter